MDPTNWELLAPEPHIFAPCLSENQFRADRSEFNEFEVLVWVMLLRNSNKNSAFYRLAIENCPVLFEFQAHSEADRPLETVSTAKKQLHTLCLFFVTCRKAFKRERRVTREYSLKFSESYSLKRLAFQLSSVEQQHLLVRSS